MTLSSVKVKLDYTKINPFIVNVTDLSSKRAAQRVAARANANVIAKDRVRTKALSKSYTAKQSRNLRGQYQSGYDVGSPLFYAGWQEDGIGPVIPRKASILRFKPKGSSVYIFRPRTAGFPGAHQLRDAYRMIGLQDYLP